MRKLLEVLRTVFGVLLIAVIALYAFQKAQDSWKSSDFDNAEMAVKPDPVIVTVLVTPEPAAEPTPEPTPEPTVDPESPAGRALALGLPTPPDIDVTSWEFMLANGTNSIDEYVPAELATLEEQTFDSRIIEALSALAQDSRNQGLSVYLSSGYRSYADQAANFDRVCANNGVTDGKNYKGFYITMPAGCSEHQTGLCCDITDVYYPIKDESIADTDLYKYMSTVCERYGFIVRFPKDKEEVTGVMFEPFHYRYVGVEAATYIMENGLCLEEFLYLYTGINYGANA